MVDASHQGFADGGDGTGQGPVRSTGREAAMGATIFVGGNLFPEQKWWGPVVLDASPKPPSCSDFSRESPLPLRQSLTPPHKPFSYKNRACQIDDQEGTHGQQKE